MNSCLLLRQLISSKVMSHRPTRRLLLETQVLAPRFASPSRNARKQWSEHGEDSYLLQAASTDDLLNGYYVDVGANLPTKRSNTFRLYSAGMRGLTIEPNLELASLHQRIRPGDQTIATAIASQPGLLEFHCFNYHVFSTCSPTVGKSRLKNASQRMPTRLIKKSLVPALPLSTILQANPPNNRSHFFLLKTDTEGFDLQVLQSNNWTTHRPRFVLTEATGEQDEVAQFLSSKNYHLAQTFPHNQLFESLPR